MKVSKRTARIITIATIILGILLATTMVFAGDYTIPTAKTSPIDDKMQDIAGKFLSVAQIIGVAVAVIMLIVLAIKYISAAPNDKAEIKKHAVVYIVGAIVLFAASGILGLIKSMATAIS